ncbi:MAG: GH39 family glycosyl hydrolase, partial [Deltaproteobacteria bacterium]
MKSHLLYFKFAANKRVQRFPRSGWVRPYYCCLLAAAACALLAALSTAANSARAQNGASPQESVVKVQVHADRLEGAFNPVWAYFGYDEPNFTYFANGRRLLGELAAMGPGPVRIRTHNLLTSGDGTPALKWGSTNAYTEDDAGKPVYDWTILDRIFDAYRDAGVVPLVEIGFMPRALSTHPDPYQHHWPKGSLWAGWAYPPKDYSKWSELVRQWVSHAEQRYGRKEVASWCWEVWNEPDIGYWQGTPEEYFKLYDYAADGVKRALPEARVGGPATTGPGNPRAAEFLREFLAHCDTGTDYATGKSGSPLDFISFHAKGSTRLVDGHVELNVGKQVRDIAKGFEIVTNSAKFRGLPVILTESDPEGCAACDAISHPENGYRNSSQYAAYEAETLRASLELAARSRVNLAGALTWAFEFEGQPYFAGFRALATNGVDLPVLNAFRMFGLMGGRQVAAESSAAMPLDDVMNSSVRTNSDINVLATRSDDSVNALVWNYHDDEVAAPEGRVQFVVEGLPPSVKRVLVEHYRIDGSTSNSYTAWKAMGSPADPSPEQIRKLQAAGELQLLSSPEWKEANAGSVQLNSTLSR